MKEVIIVAVIVGLFAAAASCRSPNTVPPLDPIPDLSGTGCARAERRLIELDCPWAKPSKSGETFGAFCRATQKNGFDLHPECLARAASCAAAKACA